MHVTFMNTGVQVICEPITSGARLTASSVGYGWQPCLCKTAGSDKETQHHFIQWQVIPGLLFLAIDTTEGDPDHGFFGSRDGLPGDFRLDLEGLLGVDGLSLDGLPSPEIVIRPVAAAAGTVKRVDMVIDFGNSRTGALLIEPSPEEADTPLMEPFELVNRYMLDAWDDKGNFRKQFSARWFSSRTQWCASPYRPADKIRKIVYKDSKKKGSIFGGGPKLEPEEVSVEPRLFQDISPVRMGREVDDVTQLMKTDGDVRTGVSSPKRYLWAEDSSWLEGAMWYMADPADRCGSGEFASKLQGPFLSYLHEADPDELQLPDRDGDEAVEQDITLQVPVMPTHAPRSLMVGAIYELLCQASSYINSAGYRDTVGEKDRPRELRSITLTYPSGMIHEERERMQMQVEKATSLFHHTAGRMQSERPTVSLNIDEASAVHLTYIWSELQLLDKDARLWFSLLSRDRKPAAEASAAEDGAEKAEEATAALSRRPPRDSRRDRPGARPGARPTRVSNAATVEGSQDNHGKTVRIACIDIGGGTTDLMIAKYELDPGMVDSITGQVLHRDGISVAGDQLVKRILEVIIVPQFADVLGMEPEKVTLLFGPKQPRNRRFRAQRINWINRLFVPLAQAYLEFAVDQMTNETISHTDPQYVAPEVVDSLQEVIDDEYNVGEINVRQDLELSYNPELFEDVVHEVFNDLLFDLCGRITDHEADIVLLAGQPSKLSYIQELVHRYLPLPSSRIVPMFNYYAGTWYPYQDELGRAPGIIVDPKSAVVVGAAIESVMSRGGLGQFRFTRNEERSSTGEVSNVNRYYWGLMTERSSKIGADRVLFDPDAEENNRTFPVVARRILIGRRSSADSLAEASPVWLLKADPGNRDGPIDLEVTIKRHRPDGKREEGLEIVRVKGTVAGQEAELGVNVIFQWRTLADEQFYLDTGALDSIEYD
jgi:hypothetical protein